MEPGSEVLAWPLIAYGYVIRGDHTTSEDQVATAASPEIADRLAACWNACMGVSTADLEAGRYTVQSK